MMKISTNWLNDYVDLTDVDLKDLQTKVTKSGINIEEYKDTHIKNLVIGQIKEVTMHPNSDHLHVCMVDLGDCERQIVCGAKNVRVGLKVIVALPGAVLPGDNIIKVSTIRGVESNGMMCALYELGLEEKTEASYEQGICELNEDAKVGEDAIKYLALGDVIYGLDLNPNRNDCLSHLGFAYQVAAVLNKEVTMPDVTYKKVPSKTSFNLEIDTPLCPLYLAEIVKNVEIKPSPKFIQDRLTNAGMRPINNVVDISNYIMLEYGQPLHFFDKDKVGNTIKVRMAKENEQIITLDKHTHTLCKDDIVITDGSTPVALAGVMGGLNTEVDANTKNILIESAIFNPYNIRYTSIREDLRSEASLRYEKGLNYEYTYTAMERACHLLEKYASATITEELYIKDNIDKTPKIQTITTDKINKILGLNLSDKDIEEQFTRLKFPYKKDNQTFTVTIPNRRMDVSIKEDLIEEVGSLYGYDYIPSIPLTGTIKEGGYTPFVKYRKNISKYLRSLGLDETRTHTLISKNEATLFNYHHEDLIKVKRPLTTQKEYLRQSIIPSLLNVYEYNKSRDVENITIYEISYTYSNLDKEELKLGILLKGSILNNPWNHTKTNIDFYLAKGIVSSIMKYLGLTRRVKYEVTEAIPKELHPYVSCEVKVDKEGVGYLGKIHPNFTKDDIYVIELSLSKLYQKKSRPIKYVEPNKYPCIKKDMAFIIEEDIKSENIIDTILKEGGKILTNAEVFDVYKGANIDKGKKSLAISLTFEDYTKTLTDEEVNIVFNRIINKVVSKYNATLRDN